MLQKFSLSYAAALCLLALSSQPARAVVQFKIKGNKIQVPETLPKGTVLKLSRTITRAPIGQDRIVKEEIGTFKINGSHEVEIRFIKPVPERNLVLEVDSSASSAQAHAETSGKPSLLSRHGNKLIGATALLYTILAAAKIVMIPHTAATAT